jgi:hypothetical protein
VEQHVEFVMGAVDSGSVMLKQFEKKLEKAFQVK